MSYYFKIVTESWIYYSLFLSKYVSNFLRYIFRAHFVKHFQHTKAVKTKSISVSFSCEYQVMWMGLHHVLAVTYYERWKSRKREREMCIIYFGRAVAENGKRQFDAMRGTFFTLTWANQLFVSVLFSVSRTRMSVQGVRKNLRIFRKAAPVNFPSGGLTSEDLQIFF